MKTYRQREKEILSELVQAEIERDRIGEQTGYNPANNRFWNADKRVARLEYDLKIVRMRMKEF